jgi:3-hydroxybutyryl-CoA dehydrogenase
MKKVAIIGSGTMGNGIAQTFAQNGFTVSLIDISQAALDKALATIAKNLDRMLSKGSITEEVKNLTLKNISTYTSMPDGVKDVELAIEAATENIDIKLKIFSDLDKICQQDTILASNTSSISITKIASATKRADKVIGMHFMNPVPLMKLVEIIRGYSTSNEVTNQIIEVSKKLNKVPVEVHDYPGFAANKILLPMINEAIITLHEGIADVEGIDNVMKLGMAHPMGPLQLADFIGLDVCLSILDILRDGYGNPKYAPCPLLVNMVTSGNLGVKSGQGFYSYTHGTKELVVADRFKK